MNYLAEAGTTSVGEETVARRFSRVVGIIELFDDQKCMSLEKEGRMNYKDSHFWWDLYCRLGCGTVSNGLCRLA